MQNFRTITITFARLWGANGTSRKPQRSDKRPSARWHTRKSTHARYARTTKIASHSLFFCCLAERQSSLKPTSMTPCRAVCGLSRKKFHKHAKVLKEKNLASALSRGLEFSSQLRFGTCLWNYFFASFYVPLSALLHICICIIFKFISWWFYLRYYLRKHNLETDLTPVNILPLFWEPRFCSYIFLSHYNFNSMQIIYNNMLFLRECGRISACGF